ncbi:hypothetical protein, partial [Pseudomonas chlororaphis]|uniref:hypothetical protein n=1 Tax=Pseudomonas chlororaphis TaxID=587753 RepID=UPI001B328844
RYDLIPACLIEEKHGVKSYLVLSRASLPKHLDQLLWIESGRPPLTVVDPLQPVGPDRDRHQSM